MFGTVIAKFPFLEIITRSAEGSISGNVLLMTHTLTLVSITYIMTLAG